VLWGMQAVSLTEVPHQEAESNGSHAARSFGPLTSARQLRGSACTTPRVDSGPKVLAIIYQ
jgi:hypothetical protein